MSNAPYDYEQIARSRAAGMTWRFIARQYGRERSSVRQWFTAETKRRDSGSGSGQVLPACATTKDNAGTELGDSVLLTQDQVSRITSLEDLVEFFKVDLELWEVTNFRINKWEQNSDKKGITPLYQVKASIAPNSARRQRILEEAHEQWLEDLRTHVPAYALPTVPAVGLSPLVEDPVLWVQSVNDAHIGMNVWRHETGKDDYDLNIATRDYENVVDQLDQLGGGYYRKEILILLGHDQQHIDMLFNKVGQTTRGTPQDYDTRLPKIITAVRRGAVYQIDLALRWGVPVTVIVPPGNHDQYAMYNLIETLHAWYRNVPEVTILNAPAEGNYKYPRLRQFYQYGKTGLMLTHGVEFNRNRDSLPLLFADEAPEIWAATTYREILCGHQHITEGKKLIRIEKDLMESRAVRMRALPGLTATDSWHDDQGYRHWRAATGLAYKATGGIAGIHEVEP